MKGQHIRIVVVGAGIMGRGIAQSFAQAGLPVQLVDVDKKVLEDAMVQIDADLRLSSEFGLLDTKPALIRSRITPVLSLTEAAPSCDFVVEAIPEVLQLKKELFLQLEKLCHQDAILNSNTSSLKISAIAEGLRTPGRVIGLHWFNPAYIIPLVEITCTRHTTEKVVAATKELMQRIGKKPIVLKKEVPGFVVNRIGAAMRREIDHLVEEGIVSPQDIDMAAKAAYGFRLSCLGPFEASDMIGLDTGLRVAEQLNKELNNRTEPSPILKDKVQKGELGIKTGRGWYDYSGKSRGQILEERNRKLLQQLALFRAREQQGTVSKDG